MSAQGKLARRARRKIHIRKKVTGTEQRPRLTVFRSLKHIYVQAIDDVTGATIAQASSLNDEAVKSLVEGAGKVGVGAAVGKAIAMRLKEKNIEAAVFDRNGYLYHGRVKAVADGAREAGLHV
jgi:large subunit ribosomal protein L18